MMAIIGAPIIASTQSVISAATIAPPYSTLATFNVGDIVTYKGSLYRCKVKIPVAEPWNEEHWAQISLMDEVKDLRTVIDKRDGTFIYHQTSVSDRWIIEHNRDCYPSVTVVDSAGSIVVGDIQYIDSNKIIITFEGAFIGTAYLN